MRTVKEVSDLTGISVRTLHYYDEIGLFRPTKVSETGYRLYDDKALENLQQILFFREFDMPLREIKKIMDNPAFDSNSILQSQRKMLMMKRERLDRMIHSIDDILGGNNSMNFEVFNKEEIESIFQVQMEHLSEEQRKAMVEKYGGEDEFHEYFVRQMGDEKVQKNLEKVLKWHGDDKEKMLKSAANPIGMEVLQAYRKRLDAVMKKFAGRKELPLTAFEVKEAVAEYGFVMKQMFRLEDESQLMRETAELNRTNPQMREAFDGQYGEGMAERFADAVLEFYK